MKKIDKVKEFRAAFDQSNEPTGKLSDLQKRLIEEEVNELSKAILEGNIQEIAKEAADVEYVLLGGAIELGFSGQVDFDLSPGIREMAAECVLSDIIPAMQDQPLTAIAGSFPFLSVIIESYNLDKQWDRIFDEVHRSNMSKLVDGKPVKDENGKVMKGPNYSPVDLSFIVSPASFTSL